MKANLLQTNKKNQTNTRQFYGEGKYYEFRNVYSLLLTSVYTCHLSICWNSHLHQKGRVGRTLLSIQRIINVVVPKPPAVERYWQHSLQLHLSSFQVRGISKALKTQLTEKFGCSGNTFSVAAWTSSKHKYHPTRFFSREVILFFLQQIWVYFKVVSVSFKAPAACNENT